MVLYSSQPPFNLFYCVQTVYVLKRDKYVMAVLEAIMPLSEMSNYNWKPPHTALPWLMQPFPYFSVNKLVHGVPSPGGGSDVRVFSCALQALGSEAASLPPPRRARESDRLLAIMNPGFCSKVSKADPHGSQASPWRSAPL